MTNTFYIAALLALSVSTAQVHATNNADDCKKEGGVWRENATMGGFCFKKLASDRSVANPTGVVDPGQEKANINTSRSNTKDAMGTDVKTRELDSDNDSQTKETKQSGVKFKAGAELSDKVN